MIYYNPNISVKENARNNRVSENAMLGYIKTHDIDRRTDRKVAIIEKCRAVFAENPSAKKVDIQKATGITQKTLRRYWDFISGKKPYKEGIEKKKVLILGKSIQDDLFNGTITVDGIKYTFETATEFVELFPRRKESKRRHKVVIGDVPEKPISSNGVVYVGTSDHCPYVKIGKTTVRNLPKRINTLKTSFRGYIIHYIILCKNENAAYRLEKAIHKFFKDKKVDGEWFDIDKDDIFKVEHLKDKIITFTEKFFDEVSEDSEFKDAVEDDIEESKQLSFDF